MSKNEEFWIDTLGTLWYNEILEDINDLKESRSTIHCDELLVKYGELGAKHFTLFMMELHFLKYFGELELQKQYYENLCAEINVILYKYLKYVDAM